MNFEVSRFAGGAAETQILPFTLCVLLISSLLILFLPRRYVIVPLIFATVLIPLGQVVVVGPIHLQVSRILLLVGWARLIGSRMLGRTMIHDFKINSIDRVFVLWAISNAVAFVALYQDSGALINRMGFLYNSLGTYFLMRFLFQDQIDIDWAIWALGVICVIVAVFMVNEQLWGRNVFSVFGGVPEMAVVRADRIRSQGPFAHALLAGTVGAMLLPLFVGFRQKGHFKGTATLAIIAATVMMVTSASSTPLLVYAGGIAGLCFWPFRKWMRQFRWGLAALLIGLHFIMKAPVWSLIGRLDITGSSSAYHRYKLVDLTIKNVGDWWICGTPDTAIWGWDMGDTVNQFVEAAVTGGILTLLLFIALIVCAFQKIGVARKSWENHPSIERQLWALGVCLFSNVVAFFGIAYFDQTMIVWFVILALISSVKVAEVRINSKAVGIREHFRARPYACGYIANP